MAELLYAAAAAMAYEPAVKRLMALKGFPRRHAQGARCRRPDPATQTPAKA